MAVAAIKIGVGGEPARLKMVDGGSAAMSGRVKSRTAPYFRNVYRNLGLLWFRAYDFYKSRSLHGLVLGPQEGL
jgi:hypothetical protein